MGKFSNLFEAHGNFKSTFGDIGNVSEIGASTTTLYVKQRNGGFTTKDVHNSKLFIQTGPHKGKTIADLYDKDDAALEKLLTK